MSQLLILFSFHRNGLFDFCVVVVCCCLLFFGAGCGGLLFVCVCVLLFLFLSMMFD